MKTAIVSDTNCGLDKKTAEELGIFLMPMPVIIEEETYYEGENLSEEVFFQWMEEGKNISSSQPSQGELIKTWEDIFQSGYDELVYIPMDSGLSGACASARLLAKQYPGKVAVVDNNRISVTQYETVLQAKQLAENGRIAQQIKTILEQAAFESLIFLSVNNMDYLKKGGRISATTAIISTAFAIKPIISIRDGKMTLFSKSRGTMKKAQKFMLDALKKEIEERFAHKDSHNLRIGVSGAGLNEEEKLTWISLAKEVFHDAEVYYMPLPISICVHTGPKAVGVGACYRS